MHVRYAALFVIFGIALGFSRADDLNTVKSACGKPAGVQVTDSPEGWVYVVEYRPGGVAFDLNFAGPSRKGPWSYYGATDFHTTSGLTERLLTALPCLRSTGLFQVPVATTPTTPATKSTGSSAGAVVLLLGALFAYFLPSIVAGYREIKGGGGVFVVNFFLGWTLIGWVVALAWAASGEKLPPRPAQG